jgi:hypothetical protein
MFARNLPCTGVMHDPTLTESQFCLTKKVINFAICFAVAHISPKSKTTSTKTKMIETTMAPHTPMPTMQEPKSIKKKVTKSGKKGELATNAPIFLRVSPSFVFYSVFVPVLREQRGIATMAIIFVYQLFRWLFATCITHLIPIHSLLNRKRTR